VILAISAQPDVAKSATHASRETRDLSPADQALIERINRLEKEARAIDPATPITADDTQQVEIQISVLFTPTQEFLGAFGCKPIPPSG
jgi:hypothetical protein